VRAERLQMAGQLGEVAGRRRALQPAPAALRTVSGGGVDVVLAQVAGLPRGGRARRVAAWSTPRRQPPHRQHNRTTGANNH
jgi:hypothetical protein